MFLRFCETAERIRATTKRLEKARVLGEYFKNLSDAELVIAARFLAGQIFSNSDQRTTNIGGAILLNALAEISEVESDELRAQTVKLGDLGDVAEAVVAKSESAGYALQTLADFFDRIAETRGTKLKTAVLIEFLRSASGLEAKYIVKLLSGDLRIGLLEGAVEDGLARLHGVSTERVQWTNMLTGDIGETALLCRQNKLDSARMRFFHPIRFMLASPSDLDDVLKRLPGEFAVEDKFDGIRAQAHIAPALSENDTQTTQKQTSEVALETQNSTPINGKVRVALYSRTLDAVTNSFPELVAPLADLFPPDDSTDGIILDGEILPVRGGDVLPFQALQKRLGRKTVSAEMLEETPVVFIAYDCLYGDARVLINEPFSNRKEVLSKLAFDNDRTRLTQSKVFTDVKLLDAEFDAARARGNEGLMVKNLQSPYKPGRRGRDWLKLKKALATLDVVVTAAEVGSGKRSRFLSDFTFAVRASETDATLLNVGKAYSGLTDVEVQELSDWFRAHTIQEFAHGKVRTVEPRIVLEVTFDRVQPSARHKSGYALRFPRILRIRRDKPPEEIDTLDTVRELTG